jgi:hypothetical protein
LAQPRELLTDCQLLYFLFKSFAEFWTRQLSIQPPLARSRSFSLHASLSLQNLFCRLRLGRFLVWSFVAGLPESMRQDQSPTDEEKARDSIGLDLELKDLVRFGQMFELAFIPNLPCVSMRANSVANFC